jgi:hypothetical protein
MLIIYTRTCTDAYANERTYQMPKTLARFLAYTINGRRYVSTHADYL